MGIGGDDGGKGVLEDLEGQELDEDDKKDVKNKSLMDYAVYSTVATSGKSVDRLLLSTEISTQVMY